MIMECAFAVEEIAVFESWFRREVYIARVMQVHLDYPGMDPQILKATTEQKQAWYESGEHELIIGQLT